MAFSLSYFRIDIRYPAPPRAFLSIYCDRYDAGINCFSVRSATKFEAKKVSLPSSLTLEKIH